MHWVDVFALFVVSHAVGDYVLQTEFQAVNKPGGLGRARRARRALGLHVATYTACFVPTLVWLGAQLSPLTAVAVGLAIVVPHAVQDDGRAVRWWLVHVKHTQPGQVTLDMLVDQTFHIVALLIVALVVAV